MARLTVLADQASALPGRSVSFCARYLTCSGTSASAPVYTVSFFSAHVPPFLGGHSLLLPNALDMRKGTEEHHIYLRETLHLDMFPQAATRALQATCSSDKAISLAHVVCGSYGLCRKACVLHYRGCPFLTTLTSAFPFWLVLVLR